MPSLKCLAGILLLQLIPFANAQSLHIGVVLNDVDHPFFTRLLDGARQSAHRQGLPPANIDVVESDFNADRQIDQLHELRTQGANAFLLETADTQALRPHIEWLVERGIPVVAVDVRTHGASATFHTHNVNAGRLACGHLAQRLKRRGHLAVINGPVATAFIERVAGCEYELQQNFPRVIVVNDRLDGQGSESGGYDAMRRLLSNYPNLDAVFTINDASAIGADRALADLGRDDILIASVDGSAAIVERMTSNQSRIVSTSTQNPHLMGFRAIEALTRLRAGEPVPKYNLIETRLVTSETVDAYTGW